MEKIGTFGKGGIGKPAKDGKSDRNRLEPTPMNDTSLDGGW
ncbi:MAG: hypothetical protein WC943_10645 [Elusimicrobiota bacterium]|jgi:hypothetical protein